MALMLRATVTRKAFGGAKIVLSNIMLDLMEREIVAIVGQSGCGKTTLLRLIAGLDRDFEGRIEWPQRPAPRIGMVFQEPRLLPWCSVRENLEIVAPSPIIPDLLKGLGLEDEQDRPAGRLSLGMARRLAIARAFVVEPELILLDEPFASLDEANAARARGMLIDVWRARPASAILITHDLLDAAYLADRIMVLSGAPATLIAELVVPVPQRRAGLAAAAATVAELRALMAAF